MQFRFLGRFRVMRRIEGVGKVMVLSVTGGGGAWKEEGIVLLEGR